MIGQTLAVNVVATATVEQWFSPNPALESVQFVSRESTSGNDIEISNNANFNNFVLVGAGVAVKLTGSDLNTPWFMRRVGAANRSATVVLTFRK